MPVRDLLLGPNTEALTMSLDLVRQLTITDNALTQLVDAPTSWYFI